ncbi:hypothetical protein [Legionella bozemanae]|uniref:hypothetical protein n=1 Tax=Legionella bozemanae TaxID=447 RepID=UPI0010414C38|nr:hypothetical protein [Legionella bozemanae]
MPTTTEILDKLKLSDKTPLTEEIKESLKKIKQICDSKYSNQSFYGNAALNRQMLLDPDIARLLTPNVLTYLFTNDPTSATQIARNTSPGGVINLRDAIYYGFKEGLHIIRMMPNNEHNYGPDAYEQQQKKFSENTKLIVSNISKAAGVEEIEAEPVLNPQALIEQYERIIRTVNLLKKQGKSNELLKVPSYTPESMRSQVIGGFSHLCHIIETPDLAKETLDSFCDKFLQSPEAMLDGSVIHLFYDRAHIDAALEQDTVYNIGGENYNFQDIFRVMIQKIATNPEKYPNCAKEQFCLRFGLVESDLKNRFNSTYEEAVEQTVTTAKTVDMPQQKNEGGRVPLGTQDFKKQLIKPANLTDEQFKRIREQIDTLQGEIDSCLPYPNKERKKHKVEALEALIALTREKGVKEAVAQIRDDYPDVTAGLVSTRTADLLKSLEDEPNNKLGNP